MAVKIKEALSFIDRHGNEFQKNYIRFLFGKGDLGITLGHFTSFQNDDGGWYGVDADYNGRSSSITCTMIALSKFERLDLFYAPSLSKTIEYLKKYQSKSGHWDEPVTVLDSLPPAWYYPRVAVNRLWLTNGLIRYLISRRPQEQDMIRQGKSFIRKYWEGSSFPGYEHNNWMGAVSFCNVDEPIDYEIQRGCLNNIKRGMDRYDLADINWVFESLIFLNFTNNHPIVAHGLQIIEDGQADDGGFMTAYGDIHRVNVTIDALYTLAHYNVISENNKES